MRPRLPFKKYPAAPTLKPMINRPKARTLPGIAPRNVAPGASRREGPLAGPKLDGR
jgi:hypothetical protein